MKAELLLAVLSVCLGTSAWAQDNDTLESLDTLRKDKPSDVVSFLDRQEQCAHWMGEDPYDAARGKEIEQAVQELKCDALDNDEKALRKKYVSKLEISDALSKVHEILGEE